MIRDLLRLDWDAHMLIDELPDKIKKPRKMKNRKVHVEHKGMKVHGFGKSVTLFDVEISIFDGLNTVLIISDREDNDGTSVTNNIEAVIAHIKKSYLVSVPKKLLTIVAIDSYKEAAIITNEETTVGWEHISTEQLNKLKNGEFYT